MGFDLTFNEMVSMPQSKKVTLVEIDVPISDYLWINYQSGIFYTMLTPTNNTFLDDFVSSRSNFSLNLTSLKLYRIREQIFVPRLLMK